jgi:hypothetical protein
VQKEIHRQRGAAVLSQADIASNAAFTSFARESKLRESTSAGVLGMEVLRLKLGGTVMKNPLILMKA